MSYEPDHTPRQGPSFPKGTFKLVVRKPGRSKHSGSKKPTNVKRKKNKRGSR